MEITPEERPPLDPVERAAELVTERRSAWWTGLPEGFVFENAEAVLDIATAIREAVEAEREACANIAKRFKDDVTRAHLPPSEGGQNLPQSCEANTMKGTARDIEAKIRSRSNPTPEAE